MSAITAKASRKMKKYAVLTREPRCFLGSFDFSWEQRKFGDVFDCTVPNNTLSRVELSYDEGTVLNVHYGDVLIKYGSVLDVQKDDIPRIPHRCIEDFNGALLQDGDVIIADTAEDETTGKACEIGNLQGSAIVSGLHTMVCRPRNRMALGYLGYYLNSNAYHHQLLPLMQGIKVLSLSRSNIQKTTVSYPSAMKEQQLIASYFSQLDHLITLHQRECISFTGSAGRLILTANKKRTASSWEQRKLGDVVQITMGQSPDGSTYSDEPSDYILVQGNADLQNGWVCPRIWTTQITKKADAGDLIMSVRAPAGAMGKTAYNAVIGRGVAAIKGNEFIYQLLVKMDMDGFWKTLSCGSTFESLNSDNIKNAEVKVPTTAEQVQIGDFFRQLDNLITLHQRKPFLMKWRTSDANRNQTNRLVL